jgi:LPS export ABC transporter permease LptG/LPS export ABC transporter permease LptF
VKIPDRLDRFVIREVTPPALLGLVVYTFLLMMRPIFSLIEMLLVRGVPSRDALSVLVNTVPHVLVLTVPMSFLFGVLIAVGRMNSDNEIVALQAGGVPAARLLRPVLAMGLVLTLANGWLYLMAIPDSNRSLREMRTTIFTNAKNVGRIDAGVFYEEFPNLLLYVREVADRGGRWRGVMIFDSTDPVEQRLTLARHGRIVTTGPGGSPADPAGVVTGGERWILLEDVVNHQFNRNEPEAYRFSRSFQQVVRPDRGGGRNGVARYQLDMRERRTSSLLNYLRHGEFADDADEKPESDPDETALQRRLALIELHRRVAIPAASLVFALLAVPLGVGSRSGGRGRGFIISIAVILAYYILNNNGELLAVEGRIPPWLGVWGANVALTGFAFALMTRMGRWMGERQRRESPLARWLRTRAARRPPRPTGGRTSPEPEAMTDAYPVGVQRRQGGSWVGFPTILDRHLVRRLLGPLALVLVSTSLLYVVIDLTDNVDEMAKNKAPLEVIVGYYVNLIPQLIMDVMPLALMIAVLILLTVLERQRELTAFKAGGISLYRVVVPILLVAAAVAGTMWVLGESVVPESNRSAKRLLDRIKGRDAAGPRLSTSGGRQWLLARDDESFYSFLQFDTETSSMVRFTKLTVDETMELREQLFATRLTWQDGKWVASSGWTRTIAPDETVDFQLIQGPTAVDIPEPPEYFSHERRLPAEMTVRELRAHIDELVESGHYPARLIVRWHQKFVSPLSAFLMVFLALPYGLNRGGRRVTTMQGIALALVLGIVYSVTVAFFGKLGEAEVLPALIGAWAPAVLATLFAVNRLTTLRT